MRQASLDIFSDAHGEMPTRLDSNVTSVSGKPDLNFVNFSLDARMMSDPVSSGSGTMAATFIESRMPGGPESVTSTSVRQKFTLATHVPSPRDMLRRHAMMASPPPQPHSPTSAPKETAPATTSPESPASVDRLKRASPGPIRSVRFDAPEPDLESPKKPVPSMSSFHSLASRRGTSFCSLLRTKTNAAGHAQSGIWGQGRYCAGSAFGLGQFDALLCDRCQVRHG